jgi:hypothetical protein
MITYVMDSLGFNNFSVGIQAVQTLIRMDRLVYGGPSPIVCVWGGGQTCKRHRLTNNLIFFF